MSTTEDQFFWDGYLHWASILDPIGEQIATVGSEGRPNSIARDGERGIFPGERGPFPKQQKTVPRVQRASLSFESTDQPTKTSPPKIDLAYEPIFVRLEPPLKSDQRDALDAAMNRENGPDGPAIRQVIDLSFLPEPNTNDPELIVDVFEILTGIENAIRCHREIEFFLYRKVSETTAQHDAYKDYFTIIDVGPPSFINNIGRKGSFLPDDKGNDRLVIGAVIDNDIGFLNDAFCTPNDDGSKGTRFQAMWLQSRLRVPDKEMPKGPILTGRNVLAGRELNKSEIDEILETYGSNEANAYRDLNSVLHRWVAFREAPLKNTHGTAVAALAYGHDFYDVDTPRVDFPLLGVQLPPEAAVDTSGVYSESFIVQGVRWLCWQARQLSTNATLVINISYGALAGPKDGSKFIADQIKREVECAQHLDLTVHVIYAFGNGLNNKQVAKVTVEAGETLTLPKWVIPRNQRLPSHMEIRAIERNKDDDSQKLVHVPKGLAFKLSSPSDDTLEFSRTDTAHVFPPFTIGKPATVARFYDVEDREIDGSDRPKSIGMVQLSIAPTIPLLTTPPTPVAENGDWTLTVHNTTGAAVELVCQIQRSDTAPGFVIGGQQSQFEGAYRTDYSGDFPVLDVVEPLTNDGTNSAYTNATHGRIQAIGANQERLGTTSPADYSARGAKWAVAQQAHDTQVVDSMFAAGKPVTGTYSGTRTRLSGTSAAAALHSRELVLSLL